MTSPDTAPPKEIPRLTERHLDALKNATGYTPRGERLIGEVESVVRAISSGSVIPVKREELMRLWRRTRDARNADEDSRALTDCYSTLADWLSSVTAGGER